MSTLYVSSVIGNNDANNGSTWTLGNATVTGGLADTSASGDIVYVDSAHAETASSAAISHDAPTAGWKIQVISVNRNGSTTTGHSGWLPGATVTIGTNGFGINIATNRAQVLEIVGLTYQQNSGSNAANIIQIGGASGAVVTLRSCALNTPGTSSSAGLVFGALTGSGRLLSVIKLIDCSVNAVNVAAGKVFQLALANVLIDKVTLSFNATKPTTFFTVGSAGNNFSTVRIINSDLSGFSASASTYVLVTNLTGGQIVFERCALSSVPTIVSGTWPTNNEGSVLTINCDSSNTHTSFGHYNRLGTTLATTSVYRTTAPAFTVGGTNVAWQIVTTAACSEAEPYEAPAMTPGFDTHTTSCTAALKFIRDNATALTDRDVWMEVYEMGSATTTQGTPQSTRNAQPFDGSGSPCPSDTDTWSGAGGFSNPNKQKLASTFTPGQGSVLEARVFVGKASETIYLDPQIVVS